MSTAPATEPKLDPEVVQALGMRMRGSVLTSDDRGYDDARRIWNGLIDRRPALSDSEDAIQGGRDLWETMGRHSTGGMYLNFAGLGEENEALVKAGYGVNYERLTQLKAKYDPTNFFRMNLNIPPAG
jgi:hypothetical protein